MARTSTGESPARPSLSTRRALQRIAPALHAALLGAIVHGAALACSPSAAAPPAPPAAPTTARETAAPIVLDRAAEPLRAHFNRDAAHPRLLILVSPT